MVMITSRAFLSEEAFGKSRNFPGAGLEYKLCLHGYGGQQPGAH
jgi:hypothetical protein